MDDVRDPGAEVRLGLLASLAAGDAATAFRLVTGLLDEGVPLARVLTEVLVPIEAEVGERWRVGDLGVADEHAATGAVETVLAMLAGSFDTRAGAGHVVVACAEGETHSLPGRLAAVLLADAGRRVTYLGASMPAEELGSFLADAGDVEALVLTAAMVTALPGARRCVRAAHGAGVGVLAGGRAFGPAGARAGSIGADAWAPSIGDVVDVLTSWAPDPRAREAAVPPEPADLEVCRRRRGAIVDAALTSVVDARADAAARPDLDDEVHLVLLGAEAALLVDDAAVLDELVEWQAATGRARGTDGDLAVVVLRSLAGAARDLCPGVARRLAEAADARAG